MEIVEDYGDGHLWTRDGFGVNYLDGEPVSEKAERVDYDEVKRLMLSGEIKIEPLSSDEVATLAAMMEFSPETENNVRSMYELAREMKQYGHY